MARLSEYGLIHLACLNMSDAVWPMLEFYVFVYSCYDQAQVTRSWRLAAEALPDNLPGSAADTDAREETERRAVVDAALSSVSRDCEKLRELLRVSQSREVQAASRLTEMQAALEQTTAELHSMTASRSWRLASWLR